MNATYHVSHILQVCCISDTKLIDKNCTFTTLNTLEFWLVAAHYADKCPTVFNEHTQELCVTIWQINLMSCSSLDLALCVLHLLYISTLSGSLFIALLYNSNLMRKFVELAARNNIQEWSFTGMFQLQLNCFFLAQQTSGTTAIKVNLNSDVFSDNCAVLRYIASPQ